MDAGAPVHLVGGRGVPRGDRGSLLLCAVLSEVSFFLSPVEAFACALDCGHVL